MITSSPQAKRTPSKNLSILPLTMPASKSNGEEVALVKKVLSNLLPQTSNLNVGDVLIEIDSRYLRPLEVEFLLV